MKQCKIAFMFLTLVTCNKIGPLKYDIYHSALQQDSLNIFKIRYALNGDGRTTFYDGYSIEDSVRIGRKEIIKLVNAFKDSSNFNKIISKNCVLIPKYGIKIKSDSGEVILFIGKQPCMKLSILQTMNQVERTTDLSNESILNKLDSLFTK